MPYVNIKVTREGTAPGATATTPEQKRALIKGVSDLLFEVLGKPCLLYTSPSPRDRG